MINRHKLYTSLRADRFLFPGGLPQSAVDTIEAVLNEVETRGMTDLRLPAYMLATARGEVGANLAPVREGFATSDAAARAYVRRNFPHYAMEINGHVYYGRGLVQLTWERNYRVMTQLLGIDLMNNPDLALQPEIAVKIMFEGMLRGVSGRGDFTGVALEDFFNDQKSDWVNARRIINGLDKASTFAAFGQRFYQYLEAAKELDIVSVPAQAPQIPSQEPKEPMSGFRKWLGWILGGTAVSGTAGSQIASFLGGVSPQIATTVVVTLAVVGVIVFGLIWLFPRPIVIEK